VPANRHQRLADPFASKLAPTGGSDHQPQEFRIEQQALPTQATKPWRADRPALRLESAEGEVQLDLREVMVVACLEGR